MRKWILFALITVAPPLNFAAEPPEVEWSQTFGSSNFEECQWADMTADSGYILAGYTLSLGGVIEDIYVVRTDRDGNLVWSQTYGSSLDERGRYVINTADGGFGVCAYTRMYDPGGYDYYFMKLNAAGGVLWDEEYTYTDETGDNPNSICIAPNGDYVICGSSCCFEGHAVLYLVRITPTGIPVWNRVYEDIVCSGLKIIPTTDGGFAICGGSGGAVRLIKLDANGDVEYNKHYGSGGIGSGIVELDDGYMAFGARDFGGAYYEDFWLLRLNNELDTIWTRRSMVLDPDMCRSGDRTYDGGYIMVGDWYPPGEDTDILVIRTDSLGNFLWTKSIGGSVGEYAECVHQTPDSGYVIAGRTRSFGAGDYDFYLVKLAPDPVFTTDVNDFQNDALLPEFSLAQNYPNPFNPTTVIEFDLPRRSTVTVTIFNLLGQPVARLGGGEYPAGSHRLVWDGTLSSGESAPTGLYLYRLDANGHTETKKMVLLR